MQSILRSFEQFPVVVFRIGPDGSMREHHGGALNDWVIKANGGRGRNLLDMFALEPTIVATLHEALTGKSLSVSGNYGGRYYNVRFEPEYYKGEFIGVAGTAFDVTELIETQTQLARSEAKYRMLVEGAAEGIIITGCDNMIEFVNDRVCEMFGYPREAFVGKRAFEFVDPKARHEMHAITGVSGEMPDQYEMRFHHSDGYEVPTLVSIRPIIDEQGVNTGAFGTIVDISERVALDQLQLELQEALMTAENTEQLRLARALHDGPIQQLAAVNLQLGALRRNNLDRSLADDLSVIEDAISDTVRSLRLMMFDLEPADPRDAIDAIRSCASLLFANTPTTVSVVGVLPELDAAVSNALYRIAREALTNVRKHANASRVTVSVGARDAGYAMSVKDNGVGRGDAGADPLAVGFGIRSMQERAAEIGGVAAVETLAPSGTAVFAWLPSLPLPRVQPDPDCCTD